MLCSCEGPCRIPWRVAVCASTSLHKSRLKENHMPDQFEQLKQKYQPVLAKIQEEGAELQNLNLDGNQLFLKATAVSEASKNRIWDAIKAVDPNFADLKHDIEVRAGRTRPTPCSQATICPRSASISTATPTNIPSSPKPTTSPIPTRSRSVRSWSFPQQPSRKHVATIPLCRPEGWDFCLPKCNRR